MNEVFGEENILQHIVWQRHGGGGNDSKYFAIDHEYILAYAKNKESIVRLRLPLNDEQSAEYTGVDEWFFDFRTLQNTNPCEYAPGISASKFYSMKSNYQMEAKFSMNGNGRNLVSLKPKKRTKFTLGKMIVESGKLSIRCI